MSGPTRFERLMRGELPCACLIETERVFSFMALHAINPGHALVVPRAPEPDFWALDDTTMLECLQVARRIAAALERVYTPKRIGMAVAGFEIPDHAHLHVVPLHDFYDITSRSIIEGSIREIPLEERERQAVEIRRALAADELQ
jgi:histidine triad (HIT) family protein